MVSDRTLPAASRIDVSTFARFEIEREIGKGGMAVVHAARDKETGQRVALKLMTSDDKDATERFHREVKAASQLVHPNICRVIAFGVHDKRPFLAMELVEGGTLSHVARSAGLIPGVVAAEILRQLLEALACAHAAGVVHRDIKPANVMITSAGTVKLLDFGIAKSSGDETMTQTGMLVGTPAFMSPEQASGRPVDGRTDMFSAAMAVASALNGGVHRFTSTGTSDPAQMLLRVAFQPYGSLFERAPHVPPALDLAVAQLTALEPGARYATAKDALTALADSGVLPPDGPALLAQLVKDPAGTSTQQAIAQKDKEIVFANQVAKKPGGEIAAALALHRATCLVNDTDVAQRARFHLEATGMSFDDPTDTRITDLLASFAENPTHAGILKGLADRYRALKRPVHAARFLWRYVTERGDDGAAAQQLSVMLVGPGGGDDVAKRLSTRTIMAGVKTGGLRASPASPAGVPTGRMQRPPMSAPVSGGPAPQVVLAGGHDMEPRSTRTFGMIALVLIPLAIVGYIVVSTVAVAKKQIVNDSHDMDKGDQVGANMAAAQQLGFGEKQLAAGNPVAAATFANAILDAHPSLQAGRDALWLRARAEAAQGDNDAATKDCDLYLSKATQFDDPHIADVNALLAKLRN